jgi:hypothetical protein
MQLLHKMKNLNKTQIHVFLEMVASMRPQFSKYKNAAERDRFISLFNNSKSLNPEIDNILRQGLFSSDELKKIKKEFNRIRNKKIIIGLIITFVLFFSFNFYLYLQLPTAYKISKETILYSDSTCTQISSDTLISNVDIFSNEDAKFIKAGNNSVKPSGYFNWLTGKSQVYFYKNDYEFTDDKIVFVNNFKDLYYKTTDYDSLTAVDKIGILKLLDTLGSEYILSANSNKPNKPLRNILHDNYDSEWRNLFLILYNKKLNIKEGYHLFIGITNPNRIKKLHFKDGTGSDLTLPIEWIRKTPLDIRLFDSGGKAILYKMAGSTCSFTHFP